MMQDFSSILELISKHSESLALVFALVLLSIGLFFKKEDKELSKVSKINELQNDNLAKLIAQNTELYEQLGVVREDLRKAYIVINDMRVKIIELEDMLKKAESERCEGPLVVRKHNVG